jgi:hypothetical protein
MPLIYRGILPYQFTVSRQCLKITESRLDPMLNEDIVNLSRSLKSMMTNMEVIHLKSKE